MALGCEKTDCGMGGKLGSNRSWRAEDNNRLTKEFTKRRRRNDYKKETREELDRYFEDLEDSQMQNEELITFEFAVNEYGEKALRAISDIKSRTKLNLDDLDIVSEIVEDDDGSDIWKVSYKDIYEYGKNIDEALYTFASSVFRNWKDLMYVSEDGLSKVGKERKELLKEMVISKEDIEIVKPAPEFELPRFREIVLVDDVITSEQIDDESLISHMECMDDDDFEHGFTFKMFGKELSTILWFDDGFYTYVKYVEYKNYGKCPNDPLFTAYYKSDQLADHDTVKILFAPKGYSIRYKWCEDTHEN